MPEEAVEGLEENAADDNLDAEDETPDDVKRGEAVYLALIPTLDAMAPVPFPAGVELRRAVVAALNAHGRVDRLGLQPELDLLNPRHWSAASKGQTREYALGLLAATRVLANVQAGATAVQVPEALSSEAGEVRNRMFELLWYHLKHHPVAGPILVSIASGVGYLDRSDDLARLAPLHEQFREQIKHDTVNFRAGDAKRARELSAALTLALAASTDGPKAALRAWKLFSLLETAHAELTRGARFVRMGLGFKDADGLWPTLRAAARRKRG